MSRAIAAGLVLLTVGCGSGRQQDTDLREVPGISIQRTSGTPSPSWTLSTPTDNEIVAVKVFPGGKVLAVGAHGGVFRSEDFGPTWTKICDRLPKEEHNGPYFRAAFILDEENVWAARGYHADEIGDPLGVYKFSSAHGKWEQILSQWRHGSRVNGIHFWNERDGILFAHWRDCLETRDGGKTWNKLNWPVSGGVVPDRSNIIALGPSPVKPKPYEPTKTLVYVTADRGVTWSPTAHDINSAVPNLWSIEGLNFLTPKLGWAYGFTREGDPSKFRAFLARTDDGGNRWSETPLKWAIVRGENSFLTDACFADAKTGWVVLEEATYPAGGGPAFPAVSILGTRDGGATWTEEWSHKLEPRPHQWFWGGHHLRIGLSADGRPFAFGVQGRFLRRAY